MHTVDLSDHPAPPPPPAVGPSPAPPRPPVGNPPARVHRPPSRAGRAVVLVVGAVLTVAAIGYGTLGLAAVLAHDSEGSAVRFATIDGAPVRTVVANVGNGSLRLEGTDRTDVAGDRIVSRGLQSPTIAERVDGDRLVIDSGCPTFNDLWCGVTYSLQVPRGVAVEVTSGSGSVTVAQVDGDLWLRSGAGSVDVTDASGRVDAEAGAGRVRGSGLRSSDVRAASHAGGVDLTFAVAPALVEASSRAGRVEIVVPGDGTAYAVETDTGFGDSEVLVPTDRTSTHRIVATSKAGNVRVRPA